MLDQKEIVQGIYKEIVNDENWIESYKTDPDKMLDKYGISEDNKPMLKKILHHFC